MKDQKALPVGITQDMIDAATVKYPKLGAVKLAVLPKDDDGLETITVLIRRPDRSVMSEYSKWADKAPSKADDILVKACLLSHKDEVLADDELFMVAVDAIAQMIVTRKAVLKNI